MTKEERRALKQWLTDQLPEGTSREEIADELEVTRKTISTMLNPNRSSFGNGLTMLRYLRHVGAVVDAPKASGRPLRDHLESLEEKVADLSAMMRQALSLLADAEEGDATREARRRDQKPA